MKIIKKTIERIYLAFKILFTLNTIESKNIQENNIILIIPRKSNKANFIELIMDEKKLLHASKYYIRKPQKQEAQQLIIKPYNPTTKKFNPPNSNQAITNTISNQHRAKQTVKLNMKPSASTVKKVVQQPNSNQTIANTISKKTTPTAEQLFSEYLSKKFKV